MRGETGIHWIAKWELEQIKVNSTKSWGNDTGLGGSSLGTPGNVKLTPIGVIWTNGV